MTFSSVSYVRFLVLLCCIGFSVPPVVLGDEPGIANNSPAAEVETGEEMDEQYLHDLVDEMTSERGAVAVDGDLTSDLPDDLAGDEREHGEQWLTMGRLISFVVLLSLMHVLISLWVYGNAKNSGLGKTMSVGWALIVLVTGIPGIFLYFILKNYCRKNLEED